jgi:thermitase
MRKAILALAVAILLISSFPTILLAAPPDSPASDFSPEQILVKFKPGTSLPEVAEIHRQLGGQVRETIPGIGVQVVTVPKGQAKAKAKAYSANPKVTYAEPDLTAEALGSPDDPFFTNQWGLTKVGAPQAWDVTTGSASVNIAILDTGVDVDNPDLANKIISNINFTNSTTTNDVYGHGTHVAGIAAAITNNGIGVAGLGYSATIMNIKVLGDTGSGDYSWIASGVIWAADNGAEIINMSLGGSSASPTLEDAVNYAWSKGVVVVAAAGNSGNATPLYPAYYTNCIAVAATDVNDAMAFFSNYGDWVDVAAPGLNIYSTLKDNGYGYKSGTSMASPHVAGLAALVFTTVSDANGDGKLNDEVRSRIEATCDDIGVLGIGHGRINAARAVGGVPVLLGKISGQVTDPKDVFGIWDAQVSDGIRTVLTDVAGRYTIDVPPGSYQVVASKEGYETSSSTVSVLQGTTAIANFCLSQIIVPGSITGSVTDAKDGSPIVGATVTDGTRTTSTDAAGKYTIADVPQGSYQVVAGKEGYQSSSLMVNVLSGSAAVANFSLNQIIVPGSITGSVADAKDGSPIVSATVSDGNGTALTDALGSYTISNVLPGSYQVVASKGGYQSSFLTVSVLSGSTAVANLSLSQIIVPGSITGTVTSTKDGSVIVGVTVTDGTRTTTTDATGKYAIANVPPGSYEVTASKSGYHSSFLTVGVLAGSAAVANFSLNEVIVPGGITGSVADAKDGSPIVGATVSDGARTALTDAGGQYIIGGVPEGSYTVTASAAGYSASSQAVSVVAAQTATVNFALTKLAPPPPEPLWVQSITFGVTGKNVRLNINVVSASGAVAGTQVAVQLTNGAQNWNFTGTTDGSGTASFVVTKAPAGSYVASVTAITMAGYTRDTTQGVTSASYTLKRGGGKR